MCQGYCAILPHEENLRFIVNVLLNEIFQRTEAITHLWYEIIFEESYLGGEILCKKKFVLVFLMHTFPNIDLDHLDSCYEEWFHTCTMVNGY